MKSVVEKKCPTRSFAVQSRILISDLSEVSIRELASFSALGHCLDLVIQHSLERCCKIEILIKKCAELVTHFKRCELNGLLPTSFKQQCATRWNSTYEMLASIELHFKWVEEILTCRRECSEYIDKIDHVLLKELADVLCSFEKASEQLYGEEEPTLHLVLPWINKLKSNCEVKNIDSPVIKQLKKRLLDFIAEKIWFTQIHERAAFLHPMRKNLSVRIHLETIRFNQIAFTVPRETTHSYLISFRRTVTPSANKCMRPRAQC